jgi:hypothetical protein
MGTRGRKSIASLSVISSAGMEITRRPDPPNELSDEQAAEWRAIVNRMPATWFSRETQPLLAQYCRHIVAARRVHQLVTALEADEDLDFKAWADALKLQQRESSILCSLATKMRISQQSTYDKGKAKGGSAAARKPWDDV